MPYHVIVSRQVLLDGLMTFCATVALYCVVRYVETGRLSWLLAGGATMGTAILSKETSVVLVGGFYAFFALTPSARLRVPAPAAHLGCCRGRGGGLAAHAPASGHTRTGQSYLLWQLFRRPNHATCFYFTVLPGWIGVLVLVAAAAGLLWLRQEATWRERLLLAWLAVPLLFFSSGRSRASSTCCRLPRPRGPGGRARAAARSRCPAGPAAVPGPPAQLRPGPAGLAEAAAWLNHAGPARTAGWPRPPQSAWRSRHGSERPARQPGACWPERGGMGGGREAGTGSAACPEGGRLLAIGPSIANVLEFYGRHQVSALSISTNPRDRNPSYTPVTNPNLALRNGDFQYIVWDFYTAGRTAFFATRRPAGRFHGVAVYTSAHHGPGSGWPGTRSSGSSPSTRCTHEAPVPGPAGLAAVALGPGLAGPGRAGRAAADPASGGHGAVTPVRHFIFLMQGGRTFDDYFGTLPRRGRLRRASASPGSPATAPGAGCVQPFLLGRQQLPPLSAGRTIVANQYNGGKMDGFVAAYQRQGRDGTAVMGHYDGRGAALLLESGAASYVLFDHFFPQPRTASASTGPTGYRRARRPAAPGTVPARATGTS